MEISDSSGRFDDILGVRTFYVRFGAGPAVILIHGGAPGASTVVNWQPTILPLADAGFAVYAYDQPGFGYSSSPTDHSWEFRVRHALAFLDALNLKTAAVIGNSQGAYLAMRMALSRPEVSCLVLTASNTLSPPGSDEAQRRAREHRKSLQDYSPSLEGMRKMTKKTLHRQELVSDRLVELRFQMTEGKNLDAMRERMSMPPPAPLDKELASLACPVLLCAGNQDRGVALERTVGLFNKLPNCELHVFSQAGHWVQWDQADRFNRVVAMFLTDVATRDSGGPQ